MTPPLTAAELAACREREQAATPGPWHSYEGQVMLGPLEHGYGPLLGDFCTDAALHGKVGVRRDKDYEDARFAAASRFDVPRLLAEIDRLKVHAAEAVAAERERCAALVTEHITFDAYQQPTHSWHSLQDCLESIRKGDKL